MSETTLKDSWHLENTYATLPRALFSLLQPMPVADPSMICFNEGLAHQLGLGFLNDAKKKAVAYFSGNLVPEGAKSLAQAYAGHQFGHFTMLGDGRAVLIGEKVDPQGERYDIQLKGSGQTPYSRRGDGRATLYSMLREYLISEAMHYLGIPTTRSLAVVSTGEQVYRGEMHQGAVLTRVAASHIRVGTFEYVGNFSSGENLRALADYTIQRHYPEIATADHPVLELLKSVMDRQIDLIVHWMRVGFIHGVMNTDNMSIAGESIDYGPCAFMNAYHPGTVFSSIDRNGRYAFGNQPPIAHWNLTTFANALLPIIAANQDQAIEMAQEVLDGFRQKYTDRWYTMMFGKLGISNPASDDTVLVDELLSMMEAHRADYTQTFLALQQDNFPDGSLFKSDDFKNWLEKWKSLLNRDGRKGPNLELMNQSNPKVIPRNHWVENALEAAVEGNMDPFNHLLKVLSEPYSDQPEQLQLQELPEDFDLHYQTFCGT